MNIRLNGKPFTVIGVGIDLVRLLVQANVEKPDMVSVQLNGEFVDKSAFAATFVKEGDEVDFLYFMGGGAGTAL